jgi:HD-like signal output (HDOD) protein/CheY-like chemotaxis protein
VKRLLFVDDDQNVLDGLRSLLRKQRKEWEMSFVTSGDAALSALATAPFDVIVSDMRMPVMDGAALLRRVQQDHPHVVRIVLSGQTELEASRQMVHVAHQFVSKPCDGQDLHLVIERACNLRKLLEHPALRQAVGEIGQLPVKPAVYSRLVEVLANPRSSMSDASRVIEKDIGTSTKVLQVVNSAFFGLPRRVSDIATAVSYIGLEMVKALTLSVEMKASQANIKAPPGFSVDALQEHGMLASRIARRLLPDKLKAQDAFSAAMLQDAGLLVLLSKLPGTFQKILVRAREGGIPLHEAELEILGVSHAEIGAYLLGIWGLPYSIVEGVAYHHAPAAAASQGLDVVCAVHVASALADEVSPADRDKHPGAGIALDEAYLEAHGLTSQLPSWRAIAREEASRGSN